MPPSEMNFNRNDFYLKTVIGSTFYWEGGVASASKLERPCLYLEKGVPKYLYGATRADKEQSLSFNVGLLQIVLCSMILVRDRVSFSSGGVNYCRECFVSYPDVVMVLHLTTGKKGKTSGKIRLTDAHRAVISVSENKIIATGKLVDCRIKSFLGNKLEVNYNARMFLLQTKKGTTCAPIQLFN